ncbi:zinc-binding dehydrogenase [Vibrio superstes]|uniref:Alcohol dehydrogenase n=1 Tax=Vibrio superstes NBRC 103154 TaxID=1219062 RepID=A0A511QPH1_9VIBR|nr:zinc-binding dehydrogenase [Vibrio superstes]GEM79220.1 alcohol dehydrogenase [Vibrio superstes NBRC 103154]
MKALTYNASRDQFILKLLSMPQIETGWDVVVKVDAVALNPVDAKVHLWKGMVENMNDDFVGGLDVAGEIVEVGDKVIEWSVGDRVLYHGNMRRTQGGFAEYAVQDSRTLIEHPDTDSAVAAATPCAGWTAWCALVDKLDIAKRDSIFIAGGSGGVGSFAIQLAKHYKVPTIITTCSAKNHAFVEELGATHCIDYLESDVVAKVDEIMQGKGVEVALDCVGGDNDILCSKVLGYQGQMVELVQVVRPEAYENAFLRGLSFHQLSLGSGHVNHRRGRNAIVSAGNAFNLLLEQGEITIPQLQIISLDEAGDALTKIREQRTVGKVVVTF